MLYNHEPLISNPHTANPLLAKSTKKKCTRAMKLFICHLWFPTCVKEGALGTVKPVRRSVV